MPKTDPFCKCIFKRLLNGKAPHHKVDTFTHVKGLLYKHVLDAGKQFLPPIIPKSWKFTILVEAHDKLGHQGNNHMYCLIKCQYYWKGMNKDIRKYIANCILPKSWKFTILVEAHDKLGHQGNNHMYCLIKCQYYWKGNNKDIRKYIENCILCR